MIEEERLRLPNVSLDMEVSPASIIFLPIAVRLVVAVLRFSVNVLFVDATNAFLFCVAIGILSYKTVMDSSLVSGVLVGLGSRVVLTYIMQGRRWTVATGFLLGIFTSDVVTLFWGYVSQRTWEAERDRLREERRKHAKARARRVSDPRRPSATLASMIASNDTEMMQLDADKDAIKLKRELALAEAEIRRAQEERIWAIAQGNETRAAQLKRQIQRNETLIRMYRKETEGQASSNNRKPWPSVETPIDVAPSVRTIEAPTERTFDLDEPSLSIIDEASVSLGTIDAPSLRTLDIPPIEIKPPSRGSVSTIRRPNPKPRSSSTQRVPLSRANDSILSDSEFSDGANIRLHTREHKTQKFTLEDGSEVQLTQVHLGRNKEKDRIRTAGLSVPITIIDSPIYSN